MRAEAKSRFLSAQADRITGSDAGRKSVGPLRSERQFSGWMSNLGPPFEAWAKRSADDRGEEGNAGEVVLREASFGKACISKAASGRRTP